MSKYIWPNTYSFQHFIEKKVTPISDKYTLTSRKLLIQSTDTYDVLYNNPISEVYDFKSYGRP